MTSVDEYLAAADRMVSSVVRGARGSWPRACAWLLRLALEAAMDDYWARTRPAVRTCGAQRTRLLLLAYHADADIAARASYAWWALSRAGHHHSYELGLTSAELRWLRNEVAAIADELDKAAER